MRVARMLLYRGVVKMPCLALFTGFAVLVAGCASQSPSQIVVSYASTPAPPLLAPAIATPTPGRRRRPTRIPTELPSIASPLPSLTVAIAEADTPEAIPTPAIAVASPLATSAQTDAPSDGVVADASSSVSPSPAAEITSPSPTVETVSPSPTSDIVSPSATSRPSPSAGPTGIPGQVPESQGQFVTSSSKTSRYYYARADTGWRRIHPDHRVWFLTAADLLRAFPGRVLHGSATPTPGVRPTATTTPSQ